MAMASTRLATNDKAYRGAVLADAFCAKHVDRQNCGRQHVRKTSASPQFGSVLARRTIPSSDTLVFVGRERPSPVISAGAHSICVCRANNSDIEWDSGSADKPANGGSPLPSLAFVTKVAVGCSIATAFIYLSSRGGDDGSGLQTFGILGLGATLAYLSFGFISRPGGKTAASVPPPEVAQSLARGTSRVAGADTEGDLSRDAAREEIQRLAEMAAALSGERDAALEKVRKAREDAAKVEALKIENAALEAVAIEISAERDSALLQRFQLLKKVWGSPASKKEENKP
eukprot:jgi/Mesvir1/12170/Mv00414-RA.1